MFILVLVILGLCFGSFINALVWRIYKQSKLKKPNQKYSITKGRSLCIDCGHQLCAKDLMPVVSWLWLGGRCRYCKKTISVQYPIVELTTVLLFVYSYLSWTDMTLWSEYLIFGLYLVCLVLLIALFIYDLRWQLLPNRLVFLLYIPAGLMLVTRLFQDWSLLNLANSVMAVFIGGGLFYILFQVSAGRWIGGGDVKLGFALGAMVAQADLAMLMLFLASLLGCMFILPGMITGRITKKTRIPFGPFLIFATILTILFGPSIIEWYLNLIIV